METILNRRFPPFKRQVELLAAALGRIPVLMGKYR